MIIGSVEYDNKAIKKGDRVHDKFNGIVARVVEITATQYVFRYQRIDPKTGGLEKKPMDIEEYNRLVDEGRVVKIIDTWHDTILQKYMDYVDEHKLIHVRANIREDKDFGEAMTETLDGQSILLSYSVEQGWH